MSTAGRHAPHLFPVFASSLPARSPAAGTDPAVPDPGGHAPYLFPVFSTSPPARGRAAGTDRAVHDAGGHAPYLLFAFLGPTGREQGLAFATLSASAHAAFSALAGLASARLRRIDSPRSSSR